MMLDLDNVCGVGNGSEGGGDESQRLLAAPSPTSTSAYDYDLTYSDDDEADGYLAAELGVSGSVSSPETAALLNEIQNAMFPMQESQQQQQSHLMHPLARHECAQSSEGDDVSYLAYSIASEDNKGGSGAAASGTKSTYGSVDSNSLSASSGGGVPFRPPTSVFDHSSDRSNSREASQPSVSPARKKQKSPTRRSQLKPRRTKRVENLHPNQTAKSSSRDKPQSHNNGQRYQQQLNYPPITPLPTMITNESPVTSATATDATQSPNGNDDPHSMDPGMDEEGGPEKEHITKILSAEATKRLRRHKRLKRIKKAAQAREAAVQKVRGTEQDRHKCNDAIFAFIFLCQFLLVSMGALAFGPGALSDKIYGSLMGDADAINGENAVGDYNPFAGLQTDDVIIMVNPLLDGNGGMMKKETLEEEVSDGISHIDFINVMQLVCIASGYASLCSLLALGFMMMLSKSLLHATLIFTVGVCMTWTVLGMAFSSGWLIPVSGAVALALSFFYTVVVWDRISFAATNLSVALKGMRSTLDVPFVGLGVLGVTFLWTVWWICAFIGTFDFLNDDEGLSNNWMSVVIVFFLFSYYWTFEVIKGISQATVASIIGTWWDMSEDDPLPICSSVLHSNLTRNIIGSFGSICLGSLLVGPCTCLNRISTLTRLAKPKFYQLKAPKPSADDDVKCYRMSCSPQYSDSVISRNVNPWSFTYIGLYGYKFWDSGSKASRLFAARGWTQVVSDDLIMTVMGMSSMIIGGSTACLGLIVEEVDGYSFTSLNKPVTTAFLICLFVGVFLSGAFLSIVEGSVSAILVCYAAAPVEFHANHHELSEDMKSAWKHYWVQKPTR